MIPNTQPTLVDLIKTAIFSALTETHTCMPGIIDSFDASTQTATVLPAIQRLPKKAEDTPANIPPVVQVPVIFPSAGGYSITFPVAHGDEVLLIFSERALDSWQQAGGIRPPASLRHHDYTDAVAIIGLHSNPKALSSYATDGLEIRNDAGTTKIKLTSTAVAVDISPSGGATFNADGSVVFRNGATITALGGFVNGPGAGPVTLQSHLHNLGGNPPIAGT